MLIVGVKNFFGEPKWKCRIWKRKAPDVLSFLPRLPSEGALAGPIGPIAIRFPRVSHFSPQVCFGRLRCSIFPPTGGFRYVTLYVTYVNLSASGWNHRGTYLPLIEEKRYLHEVQLMLGEGIEAIWAISNPNAQPWDAIRSYEVPERNLYTSGHIKKSEPFRGDVTYVAIQLTLAPSNQKGCEGTSEIDFVGGRGGRMFFVVSFGGSSRHDFALPTPRTTPGVEQVPHWESLSRRWELRL